MGRAPRILILTGCGLNCEDESQFAWERAGARAERLHVNDLIERPRRLLDYAGLMFIGGFSYGDHMGSGHALAVRLRHRLREDLERFVRTGRLVLGVCNGFQIMVKLGLLPGHEGGGFIPSVALLPNACGTFQNRWVRVAFDPGSPCVFTEGLGVMDLPVRHGEGRLHVPRAALLDSLEAKGLAACRYVDAEGRPADKFPDNPNGSAHAIAGLCDASGRVFGLMPHPEAFLYPENHPQWDRRRAAGHAPREGDGLRFFRNAVAFLNRA